MSLRTFTDQLGDQVKISFPPQRIISLVPSQTELLADLGLDGRVSGITKFCVHPKAWQKSKPIVGGTKNFRFEVIESLKPDLIIGNKEENYREGINQLKLSYPVWMSDISTSQDAHAMIEQIGILTDTSEQASNIIEQIRGAFSSMDKLPPLRALYLIWRKPWMGAASGTFIHEIMTLAGLQNCLRANSRYPELTNNDIKMLKPQVILLSSEPYPFQEKHTVEIQEISPTAKVIKVDGEMFSWYGSRLRKFPAYLKTLIPMLY